MKYILAFDLGTTSLKTALIGEDGSIAGASTQEYSPYMPEPGFVEMAPQRYWEAIIHGTHDALQTARVSSEMVTAIGFSSQGQTFIPIDRHGRELHDAVVWLDTRANHVVENWQSDGLSAEAYHQISGYPWIPPELTIFKIAWLTQHNPPLLQAWKFLCLPDYIIYRLTGEAVTDTVTARMGGGYNLQSGSWEANILARAGITAEQLPRLQPGGTVAGQLQPDCAAALGLLAGISVCTGTNDQLAGAIGAGNLLPGMVTETTGTALAAVTTTAALVSDSRLMMGEHAVAGRFYAMAYANTSAVLLTWFREICGQSQVDYSDFLSGAARIAPGSDGITVLPHFMGAAPPNGNPQSRGAILGLSLAHTRDHLIRAIMETCACLLRECLEPFSERQMPIVSVRSLGRAASSDLWLQIKADMLGLSIERPECSETAVLGAAMLAAVATGWFVDLAEAAIAWYRPSARFEPRPANQAVYQEVYAQYRHYSRLFYGTAKE